MTASNDRKNELLAVLTDAETSAVSLRHRAQEVAESARYAEGLAHTLRPVIESLSGDSALPNDLWLDLTGAWRAQREQDVVTFNAFGSSTVSSATTAVATLTTTAASRVISEWVVPSDRHVETLKSFLHRPSLVDEIRQAMKEFALDSTHRGSRSPVDLLDEAASGISRPAGDGPAPVGTLIASRGSLEASVAVLLLRRPRQEPARNAKAKVVSIGQQCGLDGLNTDHFERLGNRYAKLLDSLSGAKQGAVTSGQVDAYFDEVLQFFSAFLGSLDHAKFR